MNIITMNDLIRTPRPKRTIDPRNPHQDYKVIFSVLKPTNKPQSIERDHKRQLKLATSQQPSHQTSKQKHQAPPSTYAKHQKTPSNPNIADYQTPTNRHDLRIDLKSFRQTQVDCIKTEETIQSKIMFHSQRKQIQGSPQVFRLTSRCLQIEDIILNAPYFNGRDGQRTINKIIKLKRPSK